MKKNLTFVLLMFFCTFIVKVYSENRPSESIELKKRNASGNMRAPALNPPSFNGMLTMNMLTITAQNYTGNVQVQITGAGGNVFHSFYMDGAAAETVYLTTLPAGNYTISLITESGTYTGSFVL